MILNKIQYYNKLYKIEKKRTVSHIPMKTNITDIIDMLIMHI